METEKILQLLKTNVLEKNPNVDEPTVYPNLKLEIILKDIFFRGFKT